MVARAGSRPETWSQSSLNDFLDKISGAEAFVSAFECLGCNVAAYSFAKLENSDTIVRYHFLGRS
jgi:hypothetical protein